MISKTAIRQFLNRRVRDSNVLKRDHDKVKRIIRRLDPKPRFHTKPHRHQLACFALGIKEDSFYFGLDMGLGKTKLVLDIFSWRCRAGLQPKSMLALVFNTSNISSWADQIQEHAPHLRVTQFLPGADAVIEDAPSDPIVYVMTYARFRLMCSDHARGAGLKRSDKLCRHLGTRIGMMVLDESTAVRTPDSLTFRCCRSLTKYVKHRYCLSGTPFGKDPEALWSQFYIIDRGETLGESLGMYRAVFFESRNDFWKGTVWTFNSELKHDLGRLIRGRYVRYRETECADVPPLVRIKRSVRLDVVTRVYYEKLIEELQSETTSFSLMTNSFVQMRQLTSGFLCAKDPEEERVTIKFKENAKLDALMSIVNEASPRHKILVFNEYTVSGDIIEAAFKAARIKYRRLYGKTANKGKMIGDFQTKADVRVLLINNQSGSYGLNLQCANVAVFYESPVDPIVRRQAEKRAHRMGQTGKVWIYDLVVRDSVDERVLHYVQRGKNLFKAILEGKVSLLDRPES